MSKQIEIRIEKYLLPDGKPINITLTGHVYGRPLGKAPVQATPPVSDIQQSTLITFFIYYLTVKIE